MMPWICRKRRRAPTPVLAIGDPDRGIAYYGPPTGCGNWYGLKSVVSAPIDRPRRLLLSGPEAPL
jgi:hypothetical protein